MKNYISINEEKIKINDIFDWCTCGKYIKVPKGFIYYFHEFPHNWNKPEPRNKWYRFWIGIVNCKGKQLKGEGDKEELKTERVHVIGAVDVETNKNLKPL